MELLETLANLNPWWSNREYEVKEFHRDDFPGIWENATAGRDVAVITGPRQVGKTTLIFQVISRLIREGTPPRNILYLNFDNRTLRVEAKGSLDDILGFYSKRILQESLPESREKVYIFIDEVQKLDDWGNQVKYWQDLKLAVKFVLSGSSSLKIIRGSGESLAGRIRVFVLLSFSFGEFAAFNGLSLPSLSLQQIVSPAPDFLLKKDQLEILLNQYLQKGGYPLALAEKKLTDSYRVLLDLKSLSIKRDILDIEPLRESGALEDLLTILADMSTGRLNYARLASEAKLNLLSVQKYVALFEAAYFIRLSRVASGSALVSARKERKAYFLDTGMVNALLYKLDFPNSYLGKIAENALFTHIVRLRLGEEFDPKVFYWDEGEIDFVFTLKGERFLVELKYQNEVREKDLANIKRFLDMHEARHIFLVTKNQYGTFSYKNRDIHVVPLFAFLMFRGL